MADVQGFFTNDDPEQTQLAQRQAMAQQLLQRGMAPPGNSPGAGLASLGNSIAGALLAKRLGDKQKDLETTREGAYSKALGNFLSPFNYGGAPNADTGIPDNVNVSPQASADNAGSQGSSVAARLGATANPDLMRQLGPQMAAQMLQRSQPNIHVGPTGMAYDENQLTPGQQVYADPRILTDAQLAQEPPQVREIPMGADTVTQQFDPVAKTWNEIGRAPRQLPPQLTAGKSPLAEQQSLDEIKAREASAAAQQAEHGWQVMTDPGTGKQFNYNPALHKATDLAGNPYTPTGAAKLVTNQARSPAAMYLQKYQTEHPNADSSELADVAATFGAQQKAVRDFATGPEGNIITRLNTAVSHLDTLQKIGMALDNGDVQSYNKLRNLFREQFGSELPTNFNAAMPIVAGEVSKAIVGTQGGTREDRAELERTLTDAASKRQLSGATSTQKALLQGQLGSRRKQYENATGRKDFDKFLSGETQKELGVGGEPGTVPNSIVAPGANSASGAPKFKYDANGNRVSQ